MTTPNHFPLHVTRNGTPIYAEDRAPTVPPTAAAPGAGETKADWLAELEARLCPEDVGIEEYVRVLERKAAALAALTPEVVAEAVAYLRGHLLETGDTVRTPNADACLAVADALAALARRPGGTEVG